MAQYKTIAGPTGLTIEADADYESAVKQYADIINREAAGGWKLDFIQPVNVTKNPPSVGCLAKLLISLGLGQMPLPISVTFSMLIFVKES